MNEQAPSKEQRYKTALQRIANCDFDPDRHEANDDAMIRIALDALRNEIAPASTPEPTADLQKRAEYAERFHEVCQLAVTHLGKFCPNDFRSASKGEFVAAVYAAAESALNGVGEIPPLLRAAQPPETARLTDAQCDAIIAALEPHEWSGFTRADIRLLNCTIDAARAVPTKRCVCGTYELEPGWVELRDSRGGMHYPSNPCTAPTKGAKP